MPHNSFLKSIKSIQITGDSPERIAMMGDFEWGKYLHDAAIGTASGAATGAVGGLGFGAPAGAAMGFVGSVLGDAGSAAYYALLSNVDKASWQAGDVQTKLSQISNLIAKANPTLATSVATLGTDYKAWVDASVQRKQGVNVSENMFNPKNSQPTGQEQPGESPTPETPPDPEKYNDFPTNNPYFEMMGATPQPITTNPLTGEFEPTTSAIRPKFIRTAVAPISDPNANLYHQENANAMRGEQVAGLVTMSPAWKAALQTQKALGLTGQSGSIAAGYAPAWDNSLLDGGATSLFKGDIKGLFGTLGNAIKGNAGSIVGNIGGIASGAVAGALTGWALDWADTLKGVQGEITERISDIQKMIPEINRLSNNDPSTVNAGDKILQSLQGLASFLASQSSSVNAIMNSSKFVRVALQEETLQDMNVNPIHGDDIYCEACYAYDCGDNPVRYSSNQDKQLCADCAKEMARTMWQETFEQMPIDKKVNAIRKYF